ncbi:hypothetical protein BJ741DRAFT_689669 [Chytriomyces cf. hyalinus JEL632]|nr:hypothetical protein BJ741DRAFT_689669 [Chytriomyces cf. hyalinus JEL632]
MIQIRHSDTTFKFTTQLTVLQLFQLLRLDPKRDFPLLVPIAETRVTAPFSDPNELIPPGLYSVSTVSSEQPEKQFDATDFRASYNLHRSLRGNQGRSRERSRYEPSLETASQDSSADGNRGRTRRTEPLAPRVGRQKLSDFSEYNHGKQEERQRWDSDDTGTIASDESAVYGIQNSARYPSERSERRGNTILEGSDEDDNVRNSAVDGTASEESFDFKNRDGFNDERNVRGKYDERRDDALRAKGQERGRSPRRQKDADFDFDHLPKLPIKVQNSEKLDQKKSRRERRRSSESSSNGSFECMAFDSNRYVRSNSLDSRNRHRTLRSQYTKRDEEFESDIQAGISAMTSAVASIPERYYKYNAILSAKLDNALKQMDLIHKALDKCVGDPAKTRILQVQILNLLHAIWHTAWAKFSPKMRSYCTSEISVTDTIAAETALTRLHMWRRIVETEKPSNSEAQFLKKSFQHLQNEPTHLFRRSPFTPAHIYVAGFQRRNTGKSQIAEEELMSQVRLAFMELAVRDKLHRDVDLDTVLTQVVESYRVTEANEEGHTTSMWGRVVQRLRKEFWLSKKPDNLNAIAERWYEGGGRQDEETTNENEYNVRGCQEKRVKKGVRWDEDRYYG